jgi:hypothetical protein
MNNLQWTKKLKTKIILQFSNLSQPKKSDVIKNSKRKKEKKEEKKIKKF